MILAAFNDQLMGLSDYFFGFSCKIIKWRHNGAIVAKNSSLIKKNYLANSATAFVVAAFIIFTGV
jgi:hypothetical protein